MKKSVAVLGLGKFGSSIARSLAKGGAEAVDGRFYLRYEEPIVFEKQADEERIHKRVDRFEKWLSSLSWKPSLITVCRSANSGYLPSQYAKLVEVLVKNCSKKKKQKIRCTEG